jgi:hypothetical protein
MVIAGVGAAAIVVALGFVETAAGLGAGIATIEAAAARAVVRVTGTVSSGTAIGVGATGGVDGADGYSWGCLKPIVIDNLVGLSSGITLRST